MILQDPVLRQLSASRPFGAQRPAKLAGPCASQIALLLKAEASAAAQPPPPPPPAANDTAHLLDFAVQAAEAAETAAEPAAAEAAERAGQPAVEDAAEAMEEEPAAEEAAGQPRNSLWQRGLQSSLRLRRLQSSLRLTRGPRRSLRLRWLRYRRRSRTF